jgi:hypothetical protein
MAKNDAVAKAELRAARKALDQAHSRDRRSREQSDECVSANTRVAKAEQNVSRWRR